LTEFLYSGEQFDSKIGQQYLRARYYDPVTGRFNRLDPFFGNLNDPQSLHKYLYTHANPVNGIDPSGREFSLGNVMCAVAIGGGIGGITGFSFGYIDAWAGGQRGWEAFETAAYAGRWGAILGGLSGPLWYTAIAASGTLQAVAIIGAIHEWGLGFALGGVSMGISLAHGQYLQAFTRAITTLLGSVIGLHGFTNIKTINPIKYGIGESYENIAFQATDPVSWTSRTFVEEGCPIYRVGTLGNNAGPEAQFWAFDNPLTTQNYVNNMGLPTNNPESLNFLIIGRLRPGTNFITRPAVRIGENHGGVTEVIVPPDSVIIDGFFSYPEGIPFP
jgi:RHS repeat-associated protein